MGRETILASSNFLLLFFSFSILIYPDNLAYYVWQYYSSKQYILSGKRPLNRTSRCSLPNTSQSIVWAKAVNGTTVVIVPLTIASVPLLIDKMWKDKIQNKGVYPQLVIIAAIFIVKVLEVWEAIIDSLMWPFQPLVYSNRRTNAQRPFWASEQMRSQSPNQIKPRDCLFFGMSAVSVWIWAQVSKGRLHIKGS